MRKTNVYSVRLTKFERMMLEDIYKPQGITLHDIVHEGFASRIKRESQEYERKVNS